MNESRTQLLATRDADDEYALPEQVAAAFGPDVLTLQGSLPDENLSANDTGGTASTGLQTRPQTQFLAETEAEFYRRKNVPLWCGIRAVIASWPCSKFSRPALNVI